MKTVNINLIGDLAKAPEYNKTILQKDDLDLRTKLFVVIFITTTAVIFVICFGVWFGADSLSKKVGGQLKTLKAEYQELKSEEIKLIAYNNDIKNRLRIAKYKQLARERINNTFIPWSEMLLELATKIPKDIIILDISKTSAARGNSNTNLLRISGIIPAQQASSSKIVHFKPIAEISYLLLNINEDKESLLTGAEAKKIEFKDDKNIYEFEITTYLQKKKPDLHKQAEEAPQVSITDKIEKIAAVKPIKKTSKTTPIEIKAVFPIMEVAKSPAKTVKLTKKTSKTTPIAIKAVLPVMEVAKSSTKIIKQTKNTNEKKAKTLQKTKKKAKKSEIIVDFII